MQKKLINKIMILSLSGSLFVGCNNIDQQDTEQINEPTQQEQPQDNDLNDEYENKSNLEEAKVLIESLAKDSFGANGTEYKVIIDEETNTIVLHLNLTASDIVTSNQEEWDELKATILDCSISGKEAFDSMGFNDINMSIYVGDLEKDKYYFATFNDAILYDAVEENNIQLN